MFRALVEAGLIGASSRILDLLYSLSGHYILTMDTDVACVSLPLWVWIDVPCVHSVGCEGKYTLGLMIELFKMFSCSGRELVQESGTYPLHYIIVIITSILCFTYLLVIQSHTKSGTVSVIYKYKEPGIFI